MKQIHNYVLYCIACENVFVITARKKYENWSSEAASILRIIKIFFRFSLYLAKNNVQNSFRF